MHWNRDFNNLQAVGLELNKEESKLRRKEVTFLEHRINDNKSQSQPR